ncbi:cellulose synthase/poly-beta-1,6-N-acetylglucosamine synthase-like glycosyltransferase [Maribacter caenipelagi]|uniref:Cellulose synthase/poly-beta-1,6-N-acetylglucosamine synthase-like glycosyltransferase n=1 Tax=Maribacter caenipelagi TaxID=1447781 RepID=A0A4V3E1Z5_9FLAO|nr:glycosyltransferase [Maribacter caenipelagi]TDS15278.1 cellulose synthase/poly-beta-1,6-N-acetylglucosamine synthase-like glycosyltransferase [Maribacter caenipelagi]
MDLSFSFIIPVYNRPNEIKELLDSLRLQTYDKTFEVVIVEDGSTISSEEVIGEYVDALAISYYKKPNSGPGDSRNYGMSRAKGNYFIVLDSDCILPPQYLVEAEKSLQEDYVHCYGGPDAAHESFSTVQKAINYAMTSFLTTGGIRGGKKAVDKFQPRSFNMGISKEAFEKVGGYGNIHPGEDPDLTIRIWNKGYKTKLISEAFVFHKRRIDWNKFYTQVNKFGMVRPILNKWHPETKKITYWFPTVFCLGLLISFVLAIAGFMIPLYVYSLYFLLLFVDALRKTGNLKVAFLSLLATAIQFIGYGYGFLKSTLYINSSGKKPEEIFPKLFFRVN